MWTCPKCNREFKNKEQDHFCSEAPKTIDEYINIQPLETQEILQKVRETIRIAAPNATEKISWQMPTFWQSENLIHFASFKKHLGIYPGEMTDCPFEDRLQGYHRTKGAIQFPYNKPIDYELIRDITLWRVSCVQEKNAINDKIYEFDAVIKPTEKGVYVEFPYDIRTEFGKGRVKVHATFDGEHYDGSIVNMGVKNPDGTVCYIIGVLKDIRKKIGKQVGDSVRVTIKERE